MILLHQYTLKLILLTILLILFYYYVPLRKFSIDNNIIVRLSSNNNKLLTSPIYIWCVLVKVGDKESSLLRKLKILAVSLLQHSRSRISLNFLTDDKSEIFANEAIKEASYETGHHFDEVIFHDIVNASQKIKNIVDVMQKHFSSTPGTYYSDSLFYLSLGLYKIAPAHHDMVILLDADVKFKNNVEELQRNFDRFHPEALFGLAPELSPVYYHILWKWKHDNKYSSFGEPQPKGFPGVNSGVVLMRLDRIRKSEQYTECITESYVANITAKYDFKGHLGDQDFYTLLAVEKPNLINLLPCNWNRQLCEWWKYHGYDDIFDQFARCDGPIYLYHGNCNTPIPID